MLLRKAKQEQYARNCKLQILYALQMEKNTLITVDVIVS